MIYLDLKNEYMNHDLKCPICQSTKDTDNIKVCEKCQIKLLKKLNDEPTKDFRSML